MCFVFISSLSLSLPLLFCVLLGRFSASRLPVSSSSSSPSSSLEKSRRQLSDQQLITFPLATRHLIRPYLSHRVPLYGCRVPPPPTHLPNCFFFLFISDFFFTFCVREDAKRTQDIPILATEFTFDFACRRGHGRDAQKKRDSPTRIGGKKGRKRSGRTHTHKKKKTTTRVHPVCFLKGTLAGRSGRWLWPSSIFDCIICQSVLWGNALFKHFIEREREKKQPRQIRGILAVEEQ